MPNTEPVSCGALAITPEEQKQERVREERLQQECETETNPTANEVTPSL